MEEIEGTSHDNNGNIISSFGLKQYVDPPSSTGALVVNNMVQTRSENPNPFPVGLTKDTPSAVAVTSASASTSAPAAVAKASEYDAPLSPMPISYSVPLATEFASRQRGRVEPPPISNNNNNYWLKYSFPVGPSFTHHVLSVNASEILAEGRDIFFADMYNEDVESGSSDWKQRVVGGEEAEDNMLSDTKEVLQKLKKDLADCLHRLQKLKNKFNLSLKRKKGRKSNRLKMISKKMRLKLRIRWIRNNLFRGKVT